MKLTGELKREHEKRIKKLREERFNTIRGGLIGLNKKDMQEVIVMVKETMERTGI